MLFSGDDVAKRTGVLSGGERARLSLAKVLAHRNNCLLLDEPTNNLDIIAKDTLLEALRRFTGHGRDREPRSLHPERTRHRGNRGRPADMRRAISAITTTTWPRPRRSRQPLQSAASLVDGKAAKMALGAANDRARHDGKAGAVSAGEPERARPDRARKPDRDRKRAPNSRRRAALESDIEAQGSRARGAGRGDERPRLLPGPQGRRPDDRAYERLGQEVERLYSDLLELDDSRAARDET